MADSIYMGLALANDATTNLGTAVFTNVSIQPGEILMADGSRPNISNIAISKDYLYPNPASGTFSIMVNSKVFEKAIISITDLKGQVLYLRDESLVKGDNEINMNSKSLGLTPGVYIVKLLSDNKKFISRLVIQN